MHAKQLHIDVALAKALIRGQFPEFDGEAIVRLETPGTVNAIFRIGRGHVARFPLQMTSAETVGQELAAMRELVAQCPVATPVPVAIGRPGHGYPSAWSVQSWIEGETATPHSVSHSAGFALDLAGLVLRLRSADTMGRPFDGKGRGGSLPDHDAWMAKCLVRSENLLDVPVLRAMWAGFRVLPHPGRVVMSHRDLTPANLLVRDERLAGVLDGGSFGPADPALDLVVGWHLLDGERRRIFREAVGASDLEWRRGAAWAFEQAMGLVWYYRQTNPTMSALGQSTLARLIEEKADLT